MGALSVHSFFWYHVARLGHLTGTKACNVASGVRRQLNTASEGDIGPVPSEMDGTGTASASSATDANDVALTDSGSALPAR